MRRSSLPTVADVARTLTFAPAVHALADRVIACIRDAAGSGAGKEFNAAHLRLEKDARDWSIILGGDAVRPDTSIQLLHPWPLASDGDTSVF